MTCERNKSCYKHQKGSGSCKGWRLEGKEGRVVGRGSCQYL